MLFASPIDDGQGTVLHHFMSYLDVTRRYDAEEALALLNEHFEARVAARTVQLQSALPAQATLLHEKELLLAEVNHRAKNSLAGAASLLRIQGRRQTNDEVRALFSEAHDRLIAMARVHGLLGKSEGFQQVKLSTYLRDLCDALRPITQQGNAVTLSLECDDEIVLDADRAIPLGIITTELITNALKYAFPAKQGGLIAISAHRLRDSRMAFRVEDNGAGMSAPREGSLGFSLVGTLVRQLRGEMQREERPGVAVTILF